MIHFACTFTRKAFAYLRTCSDFNDFKILQQISLNLSLSLTCANRYKVNGTCGDVASLVPINIKLMELVVMSLHLYR